MYLARTRIARARSTLGSLMDPRAAICEFRIKLSHESQSASWARMVSTHLAMRSRGSPLWRRWGMAVTVLRNLGWVT